MKEHATLSHVRLDASQQNVLLWRNNTGAFQDQTGRWIRYGLCNDSPALSKRYKSSDLIGGTPTIITPEMVGQMILIFTAIETKPSDWIWRGTEREVAQKAFHGIITSNGGYAGFAPNVGEFRRIVRK